MDLTVKLGKAFTSKISHWKLFETTLIPLKLVDSIGRVIWMNRSPQSFRFGRPLKIEFIKEHKVISEQRKND